VGCPGLGSGCAKSGIYAVACTPTAAGTYTVTVTAVADTTKSASATLTVSPLTTVSYPNETGGTALYGINNSGQGIGEFYDSAGNIRAFLYSNGSYTFLTPPNAGSRVYVYGINNAGDILGWSENGYFIKTGNTYSVLGDYPGARFTDYTGINNTGKSVGYYTDASGYSRGFIKTGSSFSGAVAINHPSASSASCSADWVCGTMLTDINDAGHVTGVYTDSEGYFRGFTYNGTNYTAIDHPDSSASNKINTWVTGINSSGVVVGYFWGSDSRDHGFVKDGSSFTVIDHPSAAANGEGTHIFGINDSGSMSGWYDDGAKATGFLLSR
jgi:probable HAF family extracellular repeat protein